jgi:hypothetical protein
MDWKELGTAIAKIGLPLLGAVLPIPGGAAIGGALASAIGAKAEPGDILAKLTQSAEAVEKAHEFELTHQETMLKLSLEHELAQRQADSADLAQVNETMRAELVNAQGEAWYQKAWRPANGFAVAIGSLFATVGACYLCYVGIIQKDPSAIAAIPQLATSISLILAVPGAAVGIAAWHRGRMQREQISAHEAQT